MSAPRVQQPSASRPSVSRPSVQPKVGPGGGPGISARDRPGVVNPPKLSPGTRPGIDVGKRPSVQPKVGGKGFDPGLGKGIAGSKPGPGIGGKTGIGKGTDIAGKRPGIDGGTRPGTLPSTRPGTRPSTLPGLGLGIGAGLGAARAGDVLGRRQDNIQDRKSNVADRSQNLHDRMDSRQDFRNMSQQDRQEFANNRREDWQNWHDDYYHHHDGWYHGGWCDHWGGYWDHMWSEHTGAMVLGTTMWGLNRMSYWFGYDSYANPYYSEPLVVDNTTIYYSEPLAAPPPIVESSAPVIIEGGVPTAPLPPGVTQAGLDQFEAARSAFYEGDYQTALQATNKTLASMPKDAVVHEFRALVLFALGKYRDAATTLHPVLAVGPGWDWTTMSSLYADTETYTKQLRALEDYVTRNPQAPEGHFVLGYHYLTIGQQERAAGELLQVHKALPDDTVSAQLLELMGKSAAPQEPPPESTVKIDADALVGKWKATRGSKASFDLTLSKGGEFTWTYREGKKTQAVKGAYAVDGNTLALEPDEGGVMLAEITDPTNGMFRFRTLGAPDSDPGLTFKR